MKLDFEKIKDITRGALSIVKESGYYRFHRMTDRQAEAFARADAGFKAKADATASVYFDFETDSEYVNISYGAVRKGSSRTFGNFDVFVNGELYMHITTCGTDDGIIKIPLDKKLNRVQVFFPNLLNPGIEYVEVEDGASVTSRKPEKIILAHGDSITHGYDALFPGASYINTLARHYDAEVYNQAIGGARFDPDVVEKLPVTPDLITVAYGTNDWNAGEENFESNVKGFFERLCTFYSDVTVYVIIPIWRADCDKITAVGSFEKAREFIRRTASVYNNVRIVEGDGLVPHITDLYSDKFLHPNDLGFKFYADNLIKEIAVG